ncbi:MAG: hypothetical protein M3458_20815 [Acidobacteriota bacterium]|nr:hypothetical protein [Acidobacteriota bacterium]
MKKISTLARLLDELAFCVTMAQLYAATADWKRAVIYQRDAAAIQRRIDRLERGRRERKIVFPEIRAGVREWVRNLDAVGR